MKCRNLLWIALLWTGLASAEDPAAPVYRVIGHLEKADRTITIKSGLKGTVYSVKTKEGKILFDNLSAEQLRARAPELHQLIKFGVVGKSDSEKDARMRGTMDASLRVPR